MGKNDDNKKIKDTTTLSSNDNNKTDSDSSHTTHWYEKVWGKNTVAAIFAFILGSQLPEMLLFITIIGSIGYFLYSLIKKKKLRTSVIALIIGFILVPLGSNMIPSTTNTSSQPAHSTEVQKAKHAKHKEKIKTKARKQRKTKKATKHKPAKKVATHTAKPRKTHHRHHKTVNKSDRGTSNSEDDSDSENSSNSKQQVASNHNDQNGNTKGYTQQEGYVYVAPEHGKRYHYNPNCRGLSNANEIEKMTVAEAEQQGYTHCQVEGGN